MQVQHSLQRKSIELLTKQNLQQFLIQLINAFSSASTRRMTDSTELISRKQRESKILKWPIIPETIEFTRSFVIIYGAVSYYMVRTVTLLIK